ncbi:hypothetical protein STA3757_37010 [Stanieria sp. NIES-3757]|nr:hypothetical protein STA3757_37010 [Stanieria sp. NIES-3757]
MNYLILSSLSFIVGTIVGLTGVGGASLITPMLIFGFHIPASVAVGSDVVAATLMKLVGGVKHWQQKTFNWQIIKWMTCGSIPGTLIGIGILNLIKQDQYLLDHFLIRAIGIIILLVSLIALINLIIAIFLPAIQLPSLPKFDLETTLGRSLTILVGAILGCLVGLTSVSSGSIFALVLITFFNLESRQLIGTDIVHGAILLAFTSLGHLGLGTVDWHLVIPIWLGSIPGILVGTKLCQIIPQNLLRLITYLVLEMVSWKLVY